MSAMAGNPGQFSSLHGSEFYAFEDSAIQDQGVTNPGHGVLPALSAFSFKF